MRLRRKGKKRKTSAGFFLFSFCFWQLDPVHTTHPPHREGGEGSRGRAACSSIQPSPRTLCRANATRIMGPILIRACVVLTTLGETDLANSRRYPDGTQQQHVERATRWTCAGTCIGQRPNYSVCALLGAEAGAPFSSPAPSFADSRRRYPRVGCRLDRMERTVLDAVMGLL